MVTKFGRVAAYTLLGALVLTGCGDDESTNQVPVANAGSAQSVKVGEAANLDGSKSKDPDGDKLTYAWAVKTQPQGSTLAIDAKTEKVGLTPAVAGEYEVELTVNDGRGGSAKATVKVTASAQSQNGKPIAKAEGPVKALIDTEIKLDGSKSTDPDQGDTLTYEWAFKTKPTNSAASLKDGTTAKPTFKADVAGDYIVTLVAGDGKAKSDAVELKIKVVASNAKPVANPGAAQTVAVNAQVALDGSASTDADADDTLSYKWTLKKVPTGATAALNDVAIAKPTFKADKAGDYEVELVVNDGLVDSAPVAVVVKAQ